MSNPSPYFKKSQYADLPVIPSGDAALTAADTVTQGNPVPEAYPAVEPSRKIKAKLKAKSKDKSDKIKSAQPAYPNPNAEALDTIDVARAKEKTKAKSGKARAIKAAKADTSVRLVFSELAGSKEPIEATFGDIALGTLFIFVSKVHKEGRVCMKAGTTSYLYSDPTPGKSTDLAVAQGPRSFNRKERTTLKAKVLTLTGQILMDTWALLG